MAKSVFEQGLSAGEMRKQNPDKFNVVMHGRVVRPPIETIWIWSVARRDFKVTHTLFPAVTLRGCHDERFVLAGQVTHPVLQACPDLERGGTRIDEHDGWRVAIGLLNPSNVTDDPWLDTRGVAVSRGCNLILEGVFPSRNNPPTEHELAKAESLRDERYKFLTQEALRLESISKRELDDFLRQNPQTHLAMDALGMEASWHRRSFVTAMCRNCGDTIKPGIAFHQSSAGILCVLDPERAFKGGAISRKRMEELTGAEV